VYSETACGKVYFYIFCKLFILAPTATNLRDLHPIHLNVIAAF